MNQDSRTPATSEGPQFAVCGLHHKASTSGPKVVEAGLALQSTASSARFASKQYLWNEKLNDASVWEWRPDKWRFNWQGTSKYWSFFLPISKGLWENPVPEWATLSSHLPSDCIDFVTACSAHLTHAPFPGILTRALRTSSISLAPENEADGKHHLGWYVTAMIELN